MTTPSQEPKKEEESFKEKLKSSVESFRKNEKVEEFYQYATTNTRDIIAYALLLIGILLMLFDPSWFGSTLVGVIFGLYFANDVVAVAKNLRSFIDQQGVVRSIILAGTLFALFIAVPFFFIGAAVAVGVREFIQSEEK